MTAPSSCDPTAFLVGTKDLDPGPRIRRPGDARRRSVAALGLRRPPASHSGRRAYALAAVQHAAVAAGRRELPRTSVHEALQLTALAATGLVAFN